MLCNLYLYKVNMTDIYYVGCHKDKSKTVIKAV